MLIILIAMSWIMIAGFVELTYISEFGSADYTFMLFCGMIFLALLNAIGPKEKRYGEDS